MTKKSNRVDLTEIDGFPVIRICNKAVETTNGRYRIRRGKWVKIPDQWVGAFTTSTSIKKRKNGNKNTDSLRTSTSKTQVVLKEQKYKNRNHKIKVKKERDLKNQLKYFD